MVVADGSGSGGSSGSHGDGGDDDKQPVKTAVSPPSHGTLRTRIMILAFPVPLCYHKANVSFKMVNIAFLLLLDVAVGTHSDC